MTELPRLHVGLTLDSATFIRETSRVGDSVGRLGRDINQQTALMSRGFEVAGRAVKAFAIGIAASLGVGSVAALGRTAKAALDAAGNLSELAQQAGVTVRQFQELELAALQAGVSQEQLVTALGQFGRRVGEAAQGTGELVKLTQQYGIAVKDSSGNTRGSVDVLGDLAEAVQNATSAQEKQRIAFEALGRSGLKFLPVLNEGREGLQRWAETARNAGLVLSDDFQEAADRASDSIATIQFAIGKGFQVGLVEAFAKSVNVTAENIQAAASAARTFGDIIGRVIQFGIDSLAELNKRLETTRREWEAVRGVIETVFGIPGALASDLVGQIDSINQELAELAVQSETLSKAAQEAGLAPESTFAVQQLNEQRDALIAQRNALVAQRDAAQKAVGPTQKLTSALDAQDDVIKPLEVDIHKTAKAYGDLVESMRFDVEGDRRLRQLQSMQANEERILEDRKKRYREISDIANRGIEAVIPPRAFGDVDTQSTQSAGHLQSAFDHALEGVQDAFTDTFAQIYDGSINSIGDLASSIKAVFVRLAAEITTLMVIRPALAGTGGAGGLGGLSSLFGTAAGAPGGFAGAPSGASIGGLALAGGLGAIGGTQIGGLFGGRGNIGGGVGGGIGALAGTAFGGPLGGLIGGVGGSLAGGLLGSLFSGGESGSKITGLGGGLGAISGTGEAAKFVQGFDKQMSKILDTRSREIADAALKAASGVSVQYGDEGPSANDLARLAAGRIKPVVQALGFRPAAFKGLAADEALGKLNEALQLKQTIEDLKTGFGAFAQQVRSVRRGFDDLIEGAKEFGLSVRELKGERRAQTFDAIRQQLIALGGVAPTLGNQLAALQAQFDDVRLAAAEYGFSLKAVDAAERRAVQALKEQAKAQEEQRDLQRQAIQAEIAALTGNASPLTAQLIQLKQQFADLARRAEELGVSTKGLAEAYKAAKHELVELRRAEKALAALDIRTLAGRITPFERQIKDLELQFAEATKRANEFGISTEGLKGALRTATAELKKAQAAQIDALALSVTDPFKQLKDPLQEFLTGLQFDNLNPAGQIQAAQDEFRRIARLAEAGSTTAIEQLVGAGQAFIEQAGRFGASPAQAAARQEVIAVTKAVLDSVEKAQRDASKGIETAIAKAERSIVDTLKELIGVGQDQVKEIRRLRG
jgi:hypothetical protein